VWPSFGNWEMSGLAVQETKKRLIVALAEEIGFANGFIGERSVEGEEIERKQKREIKSHQAGSHDKITVAQNLIARNAEEVLSEIIS
jgi:hypothetical protein